MNVNSENEALRLIEDVPIPAYMDDAYLMFDNSIVRQATNFEEAVNAGPFPVSATCLSYQHVNWLTKDGLLGASESAGERGNRVSSRSERAAELRRGQRRAARSAPALLQNAQCSRRNHPSLPQGERGDAALLCGRYRLRVVA